MVQIKHVYPEIDEIYPKIESYIRHGENDTYVPQSAPPEIHQMFNRFKELIDKENEFLLSVM